jgi:eukaryotic-like serine/threonine-protein kinase
MTNIGNATMSVSSPDQPSVEELAEEYLERRRRGERPTLDEYAARYPDLAGEIREFFPVLGLVEDFKPGTNDLSGSIGGPVVRGTGVLLERLGDFRLLREVGRGGMGIVYEAEQESLGRRVALKVLRDHRLLDPKTLIRFHREAKAAARLHHTNIVPVFGAGEHEGVHFYVMQFIPGLALDAVLKEVRRLRAPEAKVSGEVWCREQVCTTSAGDVTVAELAQSMATGRFVVVRPTEPGARPESDQSSSIGGDGSSVTLLGQTGFSTATDSTRVYARSVARVGLQVALALDYAHQHGILHRDIKPSNLLLDAHGMVWVTDFGLAKVASDSDLTRTGDIVGTVRYMAPERFQGRCDVRADIYALGVTLYELLARRPAFEAEDRHDLIRQVTQEEPRPLRQVDATVPRDLVTIVHTAFARDPKDRYATAADLRDELERFLADRPIRSRPVSPPERYWRWCKRNPILATASTAACVLTVAIAIVSTVATYRTGRLAGQLKVQRDEANRNLIQAYTNEAEARRYSRRVGQRFESLAAIARATRVARSVGLTEPQRLRLRNQTIAALGLPDMRVDWQVELAEPLRHGFTVDQGFERYALKRDDGTVVVRRIADGRILLQLPGVPHRIHAAVGGFSSNGRFLAMKSWDDHDTLQVWNLETRRLIVSDSEFSGSNVPLWDFHPDGRRLVFGRMDGSIVLADLADGREKRLVAKGFGRVGTIAFNPDGSRLALVRAYSGSIQVLATESGRVVTQIDYPAHVFHVAWNPRWPNLLAAGVEDDTIRIWDLNTRRPTITLEGDSYNGLMVAFDPGGDLLASRGWNGMLRLWDIRTGRQVLSMPSAWLPELHFSADGRLLSAHAASGRIGTLALASQGECRSLVRDSAPTSSDIMALAVDSAGRQIAAADSKGITIWDLVAKRPLASLPVSMSVKHVHFDHAGALLTSYPLTLRWPISSSAGGGTIGPPQLLSLAGTWQGFSCSGDGQVVALAMNNGGLVFETDDPSRPGRLLPHQDARGIAVSPDGARVATVSHALGTVKIWGARDARLIHDFPDVPRHGIFIFFSPDGGWLATQADGWELLETQTWTVKKRFGRQVGMGAFSPDSASFAYETLEGAIVLADLSTGIELARIEDPDGARAAQMVFSPDGTQLIALLMDQPQIRVWDLRSVRLRLSELDLDWGPSPAWRTDAPPPDSGPPPYRVDRGRLDEWMAAERHGRLERIIAADATLLSQEPGRLDIRARLAQSCNNLAWVLITGPESGREPARAVPLARRAVALVPESDIYLNTLGLALYRTGQFREAIPVLEQSLAANSAGSLPYDLFFLALCHARQGRAIAARAYFDRAISWQKANSKLSALADQELRACRAEAEITLRRSLQVLPDDVFAKPPRPGEEGSDDGTDPPNG